MAVELSLYSEYRIVVNAGRRTFQGRKQRTVLWRWKTGVWGCAARRI